MNQNQIQQLTLHLSQALDQNYDVVNMEAVLSVICALEGTTITKDQLEATRLAKYINQLRRRTKNDQLARRAKSLLKKWREMVGIQHTVGDTQPTKPIAVINITESTISDNNNISAGHPYYSNQPDSTLPNIDLSNPPQFENDTLQQQTSFSNLIQHISIADSEESCKLTKNPLNSNQQKSTTLINELSTNSTLAAGSGADKLNESSIVIDIESDSDENDCGRQLPTQPKFTTSSFSTFLTQDYTKPKKLKKDKKRKEKVQNYSLIHETYSQKTKNSFKKSSDFNDLSFKDEKATKLFPNDSEILSLSNSSMSSILSGDAISMSANSQKKCRATCDLTFAGRFKTAKQDVTLNHDNDNGPKTNCQINEVEQPILKTIYEDYVNNDSSTSCSRLSSFEERSQQIHLKSFVEPNKPEQLLSHDSHKADLRNENLATEVPKRRGRKKGSKGVDSLIAKESSLSQQIFLGSGVKKVKTTKELFNEIQSRKLSYNRNVVYSPVTANKISNDPSQRNRESSRSLIPRPTSSCSETSMHSPHILETNSANVSLSGIESKFSNLIEDVGNTDSDTITSDPSHDSIKSVEIKRSTSLESISSFIQAPSSFNNTIVTSKFNHSNDVAIELMQLVNGLSTPQSVDETEKLYQAQIVPCTCVIHEETKFVNESQSISLLNSEEEEHEAIDDHFKTCQKNAFDSLTVKPNDRIEEAPNLIPPKPIKSIFDLDFDEEYDPLHSMMKNVLKVEPTKNVQQQSDTAYNDNNNVQHVRLLCATSLAQNAGNNFDNDHDNNKNGEKVVETLSIFTVIENPNCVAKQRFMIQTNQVANFHINALHNFYVPNINGNWNIIENNLSPSILRSNISEVFQQQYNSYSVKDGTDVVPKYGSLTYDERIPKELSSLQFNKNFTRKFRNFRIIPPFLGIAKCLPSCRLAAKRAKHGGIKSSLSVSIENLEMIKDSSMPLKVDIDVDQNKNQCSAGGNVIKSSNNNSTVLSCDLLKFANNQESAWKADGISLCNQQTTSYKIERDLVERNRKKRRKSFKLLSATNTIKNENEDNINEPLIKRIKIAVNGNVTAQREISLPSRSRNNNSSEEPGEHISTGSRNTHQKSSDPSFNDLDEHEAYTTQSHSSVDSIPVYEDDGNLGSENDDKNSNEEYAIVQKPMMSGSNNHNHIVLTIKKTPNKMNSPASSTSTTSPINVNFNVGVAASDVEIDHLNIINNKNNVVSEMLYSQQDFHKFSVQPPSCRTNETSEYNTRRVSNIPHACLQKFCRNRCQCRPYHYRRSRKHQINRKEDTIDLELKHLFNNNNRTRSIQAKVKPHRKLFFSNELYREDNIGKKERIMNYSSSSSNYDEESEPEQAEAKKINTVLTKNVEIKVETDSTYAASKSNLISEKSGHEDEVESCSSSSDESVKDELLYFNQHDDDSTKLNIIKSKSPLKNNGMLLSFNSIYGNDIEDVKRLEIKNCDDVNSICYNSNNISLIEPSNLDSLTMPISSDVLKGSSNNDSPKFQTSYNNSNHRVQPHIEYKNGIRAIMKDDSSIFQIQQFKEWHEVLQLQSYNDEPLIVLPYVVLE
ncbi:mediator of RNA polymerase II transcription subunit 26 [Drosophila albomicans]|uniref:Mediator of RNA polymerase II transcription subunit 26 n=1 Tax=Drosophila albomicans TaxID=7291 RepID=A0A6P8XKM1_DROAB|nr:mediator of RNA polymerase II transcription subunit 26 [Drosophila albomicans]